MEGWIKLHRKILDNPIITKDSDYLAVWTYLLLNTTHKEYDVLFKGKRITLKKVQRILKTLENEHQIEQQTSNKNRLITIVSWDKYQEDEQQNKQQVNNNRTTSEQQVNTNKNVKNIKNVKNDKEYKEKEKRKTFEDVFTENHFSKELEETIKDFIDMRKTIKKPMTTKALELLIRNLEKLTNLEAEKIAILNQSIEHGWQTVYPLKQNKGNSRDGSINDFKELWEEAKREDEQKGNSTSDNTFSW